MIPPLLTTAATRAELPLPGGWAEAGHPATVAAAAHRRGPAAGVRRRGTAHPWIPVVQERRAHAQGYQEEAGGEFAPHCSMLTYYVIVVFLVSV